MPGDVLPPVAVDFVQLEETFLLVGIPGLLVDCGIEVVIPALATLLASPEAEAVALPQFLRDLGPVVESELRHQRADGLVFLSGPTSTSQLQDCRFIGIFIFIHPNSTSLPLPHIIH
jgi:hypothetical protein